MIYNRIIGLCKDRGVTVRQLELSAGLGNGTIGGWRGSFPRVDKLKRVADYFGVTVDYFLQ